MRQRNQLAAAGVVAVVLGCSACTSPGSPTTKTPLSIVRFRAEAMSYMTFSGIDDAQSFVVRDRDTWVRTWSDIHRRMSPVPPLPDIDFSREIVVVAAMGSRPSSGFDVVVASASETNGIVTVDVETRSPGPRCVTLTVLTSPIDLARVPRRDALVLFHSTAIQITCP